MINLRSKRVGQAGKPRAGRAASLLAGAAMLTLSGLAVADGNERPQRRGPPPEALTACEGLSEAAACSFSGRRGDVSGQCVIARDDQLACAPEDHQMRGQR